MDLKFKVKEEYYSLIHNVLNGGSLEDIYYGNHRKYDYLRDLVQDNRANELTSQLGIHNITFENGMLQGCIEMDDDAVYGIRTMMTTVAENGRMILRDDRGTLTKHVVTNHSYQISNLEKGDLRDLSEEFQSNITLKDLLKQEDSGLINLKDAFLTKGEIAAETKLYQTSFYLKEPVPSNMFNGITESPNKMHDSDLRNSLEAKHVDPDNIKHMKWVLEGNQFGYIEVAAKRELTDTELTAISGSIEDMNAHKVNKVFESGLTLKAAEFDRETTNCKLQSVSPLDRGPVGIPRWGQLDPGRWDQTIMKQFNETGVDNRQHMHDKTHGQVQDEHAVAGLMELGDALGALDNEKNDMEL